MMMKNTVTVLPTSVIYQNMRRHRSTALVFIKCKNTTTTSTSRKLTKSTSVVVHSMRRGHANELRDDYDDEEDAENDRVYCVGPFGGDSDDAYGGLGIFGNDRYLYTVSTKGLGPKYELALENGMDDTIGIDLVAMCLNELVTGGPFTKLFFYIDIGLSEKVISCMADACGSIECFVEQPMSDSTTKAIALVEHDSVIDGKNIEVGDVLISLPSSGVHSSGFPLVTRVLEPSGSSLKDNLPGTNITLGESLMTPTVIYKKQVCEIISKGGVKGIVHIAGGGLTKSVTRALPSRLGAVIFNDSWVVPPIFKWIQEEGGIGDAIMRRTFNMGIGMVLVVSEESAQTILGKSCKVEAYRIGEVVKVDAVTYISHYME